MNEQYHQVGGIKVSWHAIVRYLERFRGLESLIDQLRSSAPDVSDYQIVKTLEVQNGFNVAHICNDFLTDRLWQDMFVANMMDGAYRYGPHHDVILVNKHIVTIIPRAPKVNIFRPNKR